MRKHNNDKQLLPQKTAAQKAKENEINTLTRN
jgi:hypothetical protein